MVQRGEDSPHHKYTEEQVREWRRLYDDEGWSTTDIAIEFMVPRSSVSDIVKRRKWRHIK